MSRSSARPPGRRMSRKMNSSVGQKFHNTLLPMTLWASDTRVSASPDVQRHVAPGGRSTFTKMHEEVQLRLLFEAGSMNRSGRHGSRGKDRGPIGTLCERPPQGRSDGGDRDAERKDQRRPTSHGASL